jgi:ribonucleotide monophosphatase NagD (HAD superfamily)
MQLQKVFCRITEDMSFSTKCGYKKLLVLSGLTKESLDRWIYPEEYKPDYYIDSLKDIHDLLLSLNQH